MSPPHPAYQFDLRIGRILRAHGLGGDLLLQLFRPRTWTAERQVSRRCDPPVPVELALADDQTQIHGLVRVKFVDPSTAVIHLANVDDRDAAESLERALFDIDPRRPPDHLVDDVDRLFGGRVVDDETGETLGEVTGFLTTAAHPLLVLSDDDTKLVPYVDAFVVAVDLAGVRPSIRVRLPEGLLEVNARKSEARDTTGDSDV